MDTFTNLKTDSSIKNLHVIEYPGNVKNVNRMLETLGGIDAVSDAFANPQRKLECRFRPEDKFCKSAVAERCRSSSFLLRVKVRKYKSNEEKVTCTTSVVGKVCQIFKFQNLMDFQYLPMERNALGNYESVYDSLLPNTIVPPCWLSEPCSSLLLPPVFSRTDSIQSYLSASKGEIETSNTIGRTRDRRSNYVKFVSHDQKEVPKAPYPITLRYIQLKLVNEEQILRIKELFDIRPVWTKSALMYNARYTEAHLKYLLALRAYYFTSGPFRITWVRFGYDPRSDPSSRQYQIIDYRLRTNIRTILREQQPDRYPRGRTKTHKNLQDDDTNEQYGESSYIFKPGLIPPHKQMFYQVCDIKLPEVQERLNQFSKDSAYDAKTGWLSEEFFDFVREQIDKHIIALLQNTNGSNSISENFLIQHISVNENDAELSSEGEDSLLSWDQEDFDIDNENT